MAAEYEAIRGVPFRSGFRPPLYFGNDVPQARRLLVG
jgi:hypothetical protein